MSTYRVPRRVYKLVYILVAPMMARSAAGSAFYDVWAMIKAIKQLWWAALHTR